MIHPFPVAAVTSGTIQRVFYGPIPFTGMDGTQHPASAWAAWTEEDWAALCPGWSLLPVIDTPPADPAKKHTRMPAHLWTVGPASVEVTYEAEDWTAIEVAMQLDADRRTKVTAIDAERDRRLALGAEHEGKRFSMSDSSRTDQGGMATTAALVLAGALPWPESYAQGWIALDNSRLPLPTPQDGIALAAKVAVTYSAIVQHARDLKDAALVAGSPAAVDETAGWPDSD